MDPVIKKTSFYLFGAIIILALSYFLFFSAPANFPQGIVNIKEGLSLGRMALNLKNENIIRSKIVFEALVIWRGAERHMIPGDYYFENKLSVFTVARRVSKGQKHIAPIKVTIPEGFDVSQIASTFTLKLPNFNIDKFMLLAKDKEGYLFPDTYFFSYDSTEEDVLKYMSENFEKKITQFRPEIILQDKTEKQIIIMASIIEREAKGEGDRELISGILWKRLAIGMALQVDAAPDTYKTRGLPKSPIANPGLSAIKAAIYPKTSSYLYYLHDKEGGVHFAKNFEDHIKNITKYLK